MIVKGRFEITDKQRRILACAAAGSDKIPKHILASRKDVLDYLQGHIDAIGVDHPPGERGKFKQDTLSDLVDRVRQEDAEALAGKSFSYCLGWAKVKYKYGARI